MTTPNSRVRGTATSPAARPGSLTVTGALGLTRLSALRTRHSEGTPAAEVAGLLVDTAREADRLADELRRHARHARSDLDTALEDLDENHTADVTGILGHSGQNVEVTSARYAQQMRQLGAVLAAYRAAWPDPAAATPSGSLAFTSPPRAAGTSAGPSSSLSGARRRVGPCPCECNRGGFCGGCGHAGCAGRRR